MESTQPQGNFMANPAAFNNAPLGTPPPAPVTPDALAPKSIKLSDGRTAVVAKGIGKHVIAAQRIANGDSDKMMAAMACQLTTIDGQPIMYEDLELLPLADFLAIQAEFAEQNF